MKKLAITAVLILVLGTAATAMQGAQDQTFMGAVSSVDVELKTLTVQPTASEAESMTFKVDDQTKIQGEGADPAEGSLSLEDIEAGQQVNVTYVESGGDNVARTITVQAKPTT
ncbi:MAG TPA: hypothetical protein VGC53_05355 [Vicinamibacteria bacterium]|jgi:hypothetical protein